MAEVSIIVTCYNIEAHIERCLESLAAQTLQDIEIIVVDDGSTDDSPRVIERFAARDERFRAVLLPHNSPGGVGTAANAGLERASSAYVGFADGDDYFEPTMFEELLGAAKAHDADLVMCQYEEVVDQTGEHRNPADARRWEQLRDVYFDLDVESRKMFLRFIAVPWRKLYRRELIESSEIRFPVGDFFYEDNPFHWFAVLSAHSMAVVPKVLCYHRVARAGQTMATSDTRLFKIFEHHGTINDWLRDRGLERAYRTTLLAWVISQMEWIAPRTPPQHQRALFDVLVPILAPHPQRTIDQALTEGGKGATGRHLAHAVRRRDFAAFVGTAPPTTATRGLLAKTRHHLRTAGPRHTAKVVGRYAGQRVASARRRAPRFFRRRTWADVSDVLFALAVVQQRLEVLEKAVSDHRRSHDQRDDAGPAGADGR